MKARKKNAVAGISETANIQNGKSSAADKSTDWFRFEPARYNAELAAIIRAAKSDAEIVEWAIALGRAMAEKRHGLNPVADWMLSERAAFKAEASVNGTRGRAKQMGVAGAPPATPDHPRPPPAIRNETKPNRQKIKTETRNPKKAAGSVSDSVDKSSLGSEQPEAEKDAAWTVDDPCQFAAQFCGQGKDRFTRNTFAKSFREVGDQAFREEIHAFMAEIEAGEPVEHRGKAFTARLTRLREQVQTRKAIRESLAASDTVPHHRVRVADGHYQAPGHPYDGIF